MSPRRAARKPKGTAGKSFLAGIALLQEPTHAHSGARAIIIGARIIISKVIDGAQELYSFMYDDRKSLHGVAKEASRHSLAPARIDSRHLS